MQRGGLSYLGDEDDPNIYNGAEFKWQDLVDATIYLLCVLLLAANSEQARRAMPYGSSAIILLSLSVFLLERFLREPTAQIIAVEHGRCAQRASIDHAVDSIERQGANYPNLFFDFYTRALVKGEPVMLNTGHVVGIQSAKALVQAKATLFGAPVLHYTRSDALDVAYRDFIKAHLSHPPK